MSCGRQGAGLDGNLAPNAQAQKQTTRQVFRQMLLTARSRSWYVPAAGHDNAVLSYVMDRQQF